MSKAVKPTAEQPKQPIYYKLEIQGIVYLVDPDTTIAYTYDPANPTAIGKVQWTNSDSLPTIELFPDWQKILTNKRNGLTES
jgi:hypothetical protein